MSFVPAVMIAGGMLDPACPECGGAGWVVGVEETCCGDVLPSGECCAAVYGTSRLVEEQVQEPCPGPGPHP